jgi:predicted ATPase
MDTILAEGMEDMFSQRVQTLSTTTRGLLKNVASCIGFHFDPDVIASIHLGLEKHWPFEATTFEDCSVVYEVHSKTSMNLVSTCLQDAVDEGILEKRTMDGRMKFCHDNCWSYCYSMVQAGKARELLHWNIGHLLLQASTLPAAKGWMTVAAAEQLNRGSCQVTYVQDKVRMAKLNLEAADLLCSNSAFLKASEYLSKGIVLLDSVGKKWEMHYDLALALHSASAEIEYSSVTWTRPRR